MPVTPTYPGVYVEEIPSGVRTIVGVATSITAFIGRARRGPMDEATIINSFGDFERIFGGLWVESNLGYAIRDFYLNGGSQAVVVRLYHADPGDPNANPPVLPPNTQAQVVVGQIKLVAATKGAWGNSLRATIDTDVSQDVADRMGLNKADLFNLTVLDTAPGGITEKFRNLSVKDSARRIDKVLEAESRLVRWDGVWKTDPLPTFAAGVDALSSLEKTYADEKKKLDDLKKADPPDQGAITTQQGKVTAAENNLNAAKKSAGASEGKSLEKSDFTPDQGEANKKGMFALEQLFARDGLFNILCIPPYKGQDVDVSLISEAAAYCEKRRAVLIVDPPSLWNDKTKAKNGFTDPNNDQVGTRSKNAALFFPRLKQPNPLRDNQIEEFAPCGVVAGVFARTDTQRGVWKAPAGLDATLVGVPQLSVPLTDDENGELNPLGINCLRAFPAAGRVVWGARTLRGADQLADEWKYIPVRRTALYIEESLYRGLKWVVFEPNDEPLWAQIRLNAGAFMHNLFRQGAFQGTTPRDAYFVKCDKETTTQNDINLGIVNVVVGFAPLKPAEFVIIKLQQMAGQIEV
jgi:uncharacterized protein